MRELRGDRRTELLSLQSTQGSGERFKSLYTVILATDIITWRHHWIELRAAVHSQGLSKRDQYVLLDLMLVWKEDPSLCGLYWYNWDAVNICEALLGS